MSADTAERSARWVRKPDPAPMTVEEASEALTAAEASLQRWTDDAAERTRAAEVAAAELADAEACAGDAAYETPDDLDQLSKDLVQRRTQVEVSHRAVDAAKGRLEQAQRDLLAASAEQIAARSRRLLEAVAARQARTDQLLAELNAWERTRFSVPGVVAMVGALGSAPVPLTQLLRNRAGWLDAQAVDLRTRAESATGDQLAALVARPPIPEIDIETAALADNPAPPAAP